MKCIKDENDLSIGRSSIHQREMTNIFPQMKRGAKILYRGVKITLRVLEILGIEGALSQQRLRGQFIG